MRDPRVTRANDPGAAARSSPPARTSSRHLVAAGPPGHGPEARRPVRGRGRPVLARERGRCRHLRRVDRAGRRPEPAADGHAGRPSRGADMSALAHLLGDDATLPPDRGLFLDTTRRLHPQVNAFVSDAFYEGRLESHPIHGPSCAGGSRPTRSIRSRGRACAGYRSPTPATAAIRTRKQPSSRMPSRRWSASPAAAPTDRPRHRHRRRDRRHAVQRAGRRDPEGAEGAARDDRQCRDGRQVPGPGRRGCHLLDGQLKPRRRTSGHGIPVLAQPPERGGLEGREHRDRCRLTRSCSRPACRTPAQMRSVDALCRYVEVAGAQAWGDRCPVRTCSRSRAAPQQG